jgi:hypothetical protein
MTIFLDGATRKIYRSATSLAEGRLPETFGGWSEGRPLRAGLVNLHSGGSGTPAGRHYDRSAGSLLDGASLASQKPARDHREERDWRNGQREKEESPGSPARS